MCVPFFRSNTGQLQHFFILPKCFVVYYIILTVSPDGVQIASGLFMVYLVHTVLFNEQRESTDDTDLVIIFWRCDAEIYIIKLEISKTYKSYTVFIKKFITARRSTRDMLTNFKTDPQNFPAPAKKKVFFGQKRFSNHILETYHLPSRNLFFFTAHLRKKNLCSGLNWKFVLLSAT